MNTRLTYTALSLTLTDSFFTYLWLRLEIAREANSWLNYLIETWGPEAAMVFRAVLGIALVILLDLLVPHITWAKKGMLFVVIVLSAVFLWHLIGYIIYT